MEQRCRLVLCMLQLTLFAAIARADALTDIQQRGTLRWGGDASGGGPYIYEGSDGKLIGFEYELVDYLAHQLGVKPDFVQWEWETLPQKLKQGSIDLVLNGYEWAAEREQETPSSIPYYIYKLQLMARSDDDSIKSLDDLKAKSGSKKRRVGVLQGSAAARYMEKEFGDSIELMRLPEITMVMGMVEQGTLDATLQDVPIVKFYGPQYPKVHAVGDPVEPGYYVAYFRTEDAALREKLNAAILKAIDDGTLKKIYQKYDVWNDDQLRLPEIAKNWPPASGRQESRWAQMPHYLELLLRAAWTTIALSFLSMPLAIAIGLAVAMGRLYGPRWVRVPLEAYVEFLRGTPLLMQLYVLYYILPQYTHLSLPEFWTGVFGLAINYSAYEAENYRAGLLAIPRGQMEAALSLGMTTWTALRRIIVPQAIRIVIPPVTNDFIALFKDTSVVSMISVIELTGEYRYLINNHPQLMLEFGLLTAGLYLLMSYPLSIAR
jgi:polar amino acid transport system substrate-binding protein